MCVDVDDAEQSMVQATKRRQLPNMSSEGSSSADIADKCVAPRKTRNKGAVRPVHPRPGLGVNGDVRR